MTELPQRTLDRLDARLHYSRAAATYYLIDLYGYLSSARWLAIVGDGENGCYEWALLDDDQRPVRHSDCGYGGAVVALQAGLNEALGQ